MDLRKEIQVALNNCQPNTNRVDKIEAIARKYAELYHALQLLQHDVIGRSEQLPLSMCTLNSSTCGKGTGCKYPHCHL